MISLCLAIGSLLAFPRAALAATASDNFQRADSSVLGSNWTATSDGSLKISSNQAVGQSINSDSGDLWTATSFGSDQFAQVTLTSTQLSGTQWLGAVVRGQTSNSGMSAYVGIYNWNNNSPVLQLFKRVNGGWTQLGSTYATSPLPAGTVLGLSVAASTLSLSVNGTVHITATDATLTGGAPGIMTYQAAHAAAWAGGDGTGVPPPSSYSVGGTLSGLSAGTVALQDNGGDTLSVSANGSFTFATKLASGAAYSVTVSSSPSGQTCTVASGSGTIGTANVTNVAVTCAAQSSYTVGGTVSGLTGTTTLQDNGGDTLSVSANGSFTFAKPLTSGSAYSVTVSSSPSGQMCTVASGSGTIGTANVGNVTVTCLGGVTDNFNRANGALGAGWTDVSDGGMTISGQAAAGGGSGVTGDIRTGEAYLTDQFSTVQLTSVQPSGGGWIGPAVRLQPGGQSGYVGVYYWNWGTPELMIFKRSSGGWVQLGSAYNTGALSAGATLALTVVGTALTFYLNGVPVITATDSGVSGGSPGMMSAGTGAVNNWVGGNITGPTFAIGGTTSGLVGTLTLLDNGGDPLTVTANGSFTFATHLASGAAYSVTVASSPSGQGCTVTGGSGTVGSGNVTSVVVSCASTSGTASASDNFQRANGSLGSNWTATSDGGLTISNDAAVGAAPGNSGDLWTASSFTSDQYSQVTLTSTQLTATQWIGPMVRGQNSGQNGYVGIYFWNNGAPELMLFLRNTGGWQQLGSAYSVSPLPVGSVIGLSVAGGTLSLSLNGTTEITATDSTFTGGAPGLMTNGAAQAAAWAGGSGTPSSSGSGGTTYSVGGTVSGLTAIVSLTDNGSDTLQVAANGSFTFATKLAAGAAYNVTIAVNPSGQTCTVANGSGTIGSASVTSVSVTCTATTSGGSLTVSYVSTDSNGVATYNMTSPIVSAGATEPLRVLKPTHPQAGVAHNFLLVLPVEPGEGTTYGDAMSTLGSLGAQDQYNLTLIEPSFSLDPWYADSATDPGEQQETFLTSQLVPWIKANLATTGKEQVWLLGFSKSGLGAQDLILKHPSLYTLAASWDFPADMTSYNQLGTSPQTAYGTNANYLQNYQLTQAFINAHAVGFTSYKRIWIGSYYYFNYDVNDYDGRLTNAGIPHDTEPPTQMAHRWDSGWVPTALQALYADSTHVPS